MSGRKSGQIVYSINGKKFKFSIANLTILGPVLNFISWYFSQGHVDAEKDVKRHWEQKSEKIFENRITLTYQIGLAVREQNE